MNDFSIRTLQNGTPGPFAQYLLPQVLTLAQQDDQVVLLGIAHGPYACGAAAAVWKGDYAELLSLFIDPASRRQGAATALLAEIEKLAAARGLHYLRASYVQRGDELEALDTLFWFAGGEIEEHAVICEMDSCHFCEGTFASPCFWGTFRSPEQVVPFSRLTGEQLASLRQREDIPDFLSPDTLRQTMDPALSFAWIENGLPIGFVLGCSPRQDSYAQLALWRDESIPSHCIIPLLQAQINACYYHNGGHFTYSICPTTESALALAESLTQGDYTRYEEHIAYCDFPLVFDDEADDDENDDFDAEEEESL